MSEFFKNFGKKIKEYRERQGYTQERLCEILDIATTTLSAWENGNSFPRKNTLIALCKALDIAEEDLFYYKINPQGNSFLDQTLKIIIQIPLTKHKQVIEILKTFVE